MKDLRNYQRRLETTALRLSDTAFNLVYVVSNGHGIIANLTHYSPVLLIYTPGGIDKQHWAVMG